MACGLFSKSSSDKAAEQMKHRFHDMEVRLQKLIRSPNWKTANNKSEREIRRNKQNYQIDARKCANSWRAVCIRVAPYGLHPFWLTKMKYAVCELLRNLSCVRNDWMVRRIWENFQCATEDSVVDIISHKAQRYNCWSWSQWSCDQYSPHYVYCCMWINQHQEWATQSTKFFFFS